MAARRYFLIIGNGIAGATAAETLRAEDPQAEIMVVADDPYPVYYRPALKDYLAGKVHEDKLWARPINFYPDRNIHFLTDMVVSIHPQAHTVNLRSGQTMSYSRLLLAHGARASMLTCPGVNLVGVSTLRTVADYQQVLSRLYQVRRVVVTGSGTLALETIETLRHRGFQVTHLLRRRTLWSEVLDPIASDLVLQQEQRNGVDVRYEQEIAEIVGTNGQVSGVITTTGTHIPCEMVLLGIGIEPLIDFVKAAGIVCGRGVKVDETMRTNIPDIYAAGDLIETTDPIMGKARVIGQWYPAVQQAKAAAYSMLDLLDTRQVFRFGNFYNATFLYGLDFASVGLSTIPKGGKDYREVQADPLPRTYQKVILKAGVPVGMVGMGDRGAVLTYKRAIDHEVNLSPVVDRLFDPAFKLGQWLDQQGVPPSILGVKREPRAVSQTVEAVPAQPRALVRGAISQPDGSMLLPGDSGVLSPKMLARLRQSPALVVTTKESSRIIPLVQGKRLVIGRDRHCDLPMNDMSVSRRHAEIFYAQDGFYIRDLGSSNGVHINKTRIDNPYRLSSGDCIGISNANIYFTQPFLTNSPNVSAGSVSALMAHSANEKKCRSCGTSYPVAARFCAKCGSSLF